MDTKKIINVCIILTEILYYIRNILNSFNHRVIRNVYTQLLIAVLFILFSDDLTYHLIGSG